MIRVIHGGKVSWFMVRYVIMADVTDVVMILIDDFRFIVAW